MLEFPKWFDEQLQFLQCPNCKKSVKKKNIIAEGIRVSMVDDKNTAFFVEYKCPNCDITTTLELGDMSLEDFALEILDRSTCDINYDDETMAPVTKAVRSKITRKEVDIAKEMIEKSPDHYDFMMNIGLTPEKIEEYNKENK